MAHEPLPLLLVHAFPMGARMWRPQLTAFDGRTVLAPSLPGFDGRAAPAEPTVDAYAADVVADLDARGIDRAVVAGLSMGGYVAFALLRRAPERIAALVLADTRADADSDKARAGRLDAIDRVRRGGPAATAEDMLPKVLGATTARTRPAVAAEVRALIESQTADGIAGALTAMMARPDAFPLLPSIAVPTLIVVGDEDTLTPPADAERIHAGIEGSRLVRLPAAGHMANLEAPDAFNAAVRAFLAEVDA